MTLQYRFWWLRFLTSLTFCGLVYGVINRLRLACLFCLGGVDRTYHNQVTEDYIQRLTMAAIQLQAARKLSA